MEALAGPVAIICLLLALAGGFKVARPAATMGALRALRLPSSRAVVRVIGLSEFVIGIGALATFAPALLVLVAAAYLTFTAFVVAALHAATPVQSCGCFGQLDTPPSAMHVGVNLVAAGTVFAAATTGTPGLDVIVPDQPWTAVPFVLLVVICTYLVVTILTVLPATIPSTHARSSHHA